MPKVEGTYSHSMTKEEAADASKKAVTKLLTAFEATDTTVTSDGEDNVGFSCKSRGFSITGKILIKDNEVNATIALPMMAIAFKGLVKAAMDKHVPKHLEAANE
ncbi:hypothetical protein CMI37_08310 [Candidatus Pacearchaeota archaeon]|nr:hypothetical protein [Candidatus Pacearchaeota archaeon]